MVHEIMQSNVTTIGPNTSVRAAAALMANLDIGMLPVCDGDKPVGIVTDRDQVVRLMFDLEPNADLPVGALMSRPVLCCRPDHDVVRAARLMGRQRVRRLVVCDDAGALIGVLSLGDIARDASEELAGQARHLGPFNPEGMGQVDGIGRNIVQRPEIRANVDRGIGYE